MSEEFDYWVDQVSQWQDATSTIPALVRQDIIKSRMKIEDPRHGVRSIMYDPLSVQYAMGYKDRKYSLTYDVLKRIPHQLSMVAAILQTRCNQVAAFSVPYRSSKSIGFMIKHKDPSHLTSKSEQQFIKDLETYIYNCGSKDPNPFNEQKRDDFETFLKKIVRDSLMFDQACALAGSWVELADGTGCPIEEVQKGMLVRTHTGAIREVLHPTQRLYSGNIIRIKVRGQVLEVTEGHPVLVARRSSAKGNATELTEPEWISAGDLTSDMYVVYPKRSFGDSYVSVPVFSEAPRKFADGPFAELVSRAGCHPKTAYQILSGFYKKNGPTKERVLSLATELGVSYKTVRTHESLTKITPVWGALTGLYISEGNCTGNAVRFTFHEDEQHLVDFVRSFGDQYGISSTIVNYEDRKAVSVILNSSTLSDFFTQNCGTGSKNKKVPQYVLNSPRDVQEEFLRYYLLGDGCLVANQATFSTVSRDLFTGMRAVLSAFGIYVSEAVCKAASYVTDEEEVRNNNTIYRGSCAGLEYRRLAEKWGFPVRELARPRRSYVSSEDHLFVKVSEVFSYPVKNIPVYNMEVEEDHSYILQGFVNHNCFEVVPDRRGAPFEFVAVDSSTIRMAAANSIYGPNETYHNRSSYYSGQIKAAMEAEQHGPYRALKLYDYEPKDKPEFVQVVNGQIENVYTRDELAFGVRNPRSDIYIQGYGYGELEQLVTVVTAHLYAEEYNRRFFQQGSAPKGILTFKGDSMTPDQLEAFKRQWRATLEGVENAWRTPILQSEQGVDWTDLHPSNREMEYNAWIEYLIKITCFTEDTPITMADGSLKRIADVSPGMMVQTHTGAAKKVKNLQVSSHAGVLHHIRAGEVLEVTEEHPLYVSSSELRNGVRQLGEPEWKAAKDVVEGVDYLCVPKKGYQPGTTTEIDVTNYLEEGTYKLSADGLEVAPKANRVSWMPRVISLTEDNAFALGLYTSEGNTTDYCSFFTFSCNEGDLVDCVENFGEGLGLHTKRYQAKSSTANVKIHGSVLAKFLSNAFGSTALQKRVPQELMTAPANIQQAFFSGVFAGDGSVPSFSSGANTATLSLASASGIEQLRALLLAQDIYPHVYSVTTSGSFGNPSRVSSMHRLDINGSQAKKLSTWLRGTKGNKLRERMARFTPKDKTYEDSCFFFVPVSETWTSDFTGKVYNIEVEDEHTYQAHRFAVHNCAVFLIDPAELNFDLHGGVQQTPLFESSQEWKLKASRDRGLKPLLRFIAKMINEHVISKIDDHFVFDFVGLDELTEQEKHTLRTEQVSSYLTLNEVRRAEDLGDLEYGDIPMNPTYIQAMQIKQQMEQQQQQQQQAPGDPGGEPPEQGGEQQGPPEPDSPSYADTFTKSVSARNRDGTKYLEIELDSWFDAIRGS